MVHQNAHGLVKLAILIWLINLFAMPTRLPTYLPIIYLPMSYLLTYHYLPMSYYVIYLPTIYLPMSYLPTYLPTYMYSSIYLPIIYLHTYW